MALRDILDRPVVDNIKSLINSILVMVIGAAVGSFGLALLGYGASMFNTYFSSLNKYSVQIDNVKWMRESCLREGRECSDDLFAVDHTGIPHLQALKDMFYGKDSLCGSISCKDSIIETWNSIHFTTFVTAIVFVVITFACIPYVSFLFRMNNGVLPTIQTDTQLRLKNE